MINGVSDLTAQANYTLQMKKAENKHDEFRTGLVGLAAQLRTLKTSIMKYAATLDETHKLCGIMKATQKFGRI